MERSSILADELFKHCRQSSKAKMDTPFSPRSAGDQSPEQHDLKQAGLASELGTQSVVSKILSGRRQINARQAKALAQRFGVSAAVYI